ncbi:magnesium/cobalt transporter CorA [Crocosphaera sp. UHCC 0190]|uniref:magnesium/cobalt transporter CorA n=1 Tax=Crocosphaera sp. UHCC 0190 TaxID=3110246 RepID=UPI002B1F804D|nr:magnesium/cobalt transporter CorA [Crocosphaera sp. UHCC 0190]MEA5511403.1 magnesium/cobalt transporter CorA [Crocosphaera sp. UHCC 0190]
MNNQSFSHRINSLSPLNQKSYDNNYLNYRHSDPGSMPGTLRIAQDAQPTEISLIDYTPEQAIQQNNLTPQDCLSYLNDSSVSWFDIAGLGSEEILQQLADIFQLDSYLLEDVVNVPQRPKIEEFPEQLLIVTQMVILKPNGQSFWLEQVSLVVANNYVISFQEEPFKDCFDLVRDRILNNKGKIRSLGTDYLAYALWDAIIDGYYPIIEAFRERVATLEEEVLFNASLKTLEKIYTAKKELLFLHRAIWPQRNALEFLIQENTKFLNKIVRVGLKDCYDHTLQVSESLHSGDELLESLLNLYLSSVSNKTNEVMKLLTIVSTIFIPLTFIAGIYGMNFNPEASPFNMPELNWYWGYPLCLGVMLGISLTSILFFWRRGWFKPQFPRKTRFHFPSERSH